MKQINRLLGTFMALVVLTVFPTMAQEVGEGVATPTDQSAATASAVAVLLQYAQENNDPYSYYSAGQLASGLDHAKFKVGDSEAAAMSAVDMLNQAIELAGMGSELAASAQALIAELEATESVEEWYCWLEWEYDYWYGGWVLYEYCI